MVASAFALSLIGLGAVQALPSTKQVEERQVWIGDGNGGIILPGDGELPTCQTDIPLQGQPPCLLIPIIGGLNPGKTKREVQERQVWIGDGSGGITLPGDGELPTCQTDIPLLGQPPCLLPPIVGGLNPGKNKKRQGTFIGGGSGTFTPGDGNIPVCLTNVPLNAQPPCFLAPIVTGPHKRQVFIGGGSGTFNPGDGTVPVCLVNVPLNAQPPCFLPPIVTGPQPPKEKRSFVLPPDYNTNTKEVIKSLELQLEQLQNKWHKTRQDLEDIAAIKAALKYLAGIVSISAPPGTGSTFTPGKRSFILPPDYNTNTKEVIKSLELQLEQLQNKWHKTAEDRDDIEAIKAALKYLVGIVNITAPPGTGSTFTPGKRSFILPPDYATNTKEVIKTLELTLEQLQNKKHKTAEDRDDIEAIKAALKYLVGIVNITAPPGTGSTFTPGKRSFILPPDYATNTKQVIKTLELTLQQLQNKRYKTEEDLDDIEAIKAALKYLVGIVSTTAPPGTGSTFTPGKRSFILPPDYATNTKEVIKTLELTLEKLQNKRNKTREDLADIQAIKAALKYLAGITSISAPPGTGSTFTPGKRDVAFNVDTVGTYGPLCPGLDGAEIALETLLHKDKPTLEERVIIQKLVAFLKGCGITIVSSPDGTYTILKPSDKRDVQFNTKGLETAYLVLLQAATKISPAQPSFANWLAIKQIGGLLELYGVSTTFTVDSATGHSSDRRDTSTITLGTGTCRAGDITGLRGALAALIAAYGNPAKSPVNIFLIEQVLVSALQLCGQGVSGWTTLVPGVTIPGGPIIPDPTIPGGPLKPSDRKRQTTIVPDPTIPGGALIPDPTIPGGEIKPSDRKRQAPVGDPAALLSALTTLETSYGTYGSGKIPVPVWLIMVNIVTILQSIPGVVVPGWPILGQGSVVLQPST